MFLPGLLTTNYNPHSPFRRYHWGEKIKCHFNIPSPFLLSQGFSHCGIKYEQPLYTFSLLPVSTFIPSLLFLIPLFSSSHSPQPNKSWFSFTFRPGPPFPTPPPLYDAVPLSPPSSGLSLTKECDAGIGVAQLVGGHASVVPIVVFWDIEEDEFWEERSIFHFNPLLSFNQSGTKKKETKQEEKKRWLYFSHRKKIDSGINYYLILPFWHYNQIFLTQLHSKFAHNNTYHSISLFLGMCLEIPVALHRYSPPYVGI